MEFGDLDRKDDSDGGGKALSAVLCSICLEIVTDNGNRSWAKLKCNHHFHLDCIGSAFNVKGAMQCPNCRKIEKGQWLYSNGSCSCAEFNMEDWIHDEDPYVPSHSEMTFVVHWCPVNGFTRLPSSFEEGELSSTAYHDLLGEHAVLAQPTAVSSAPHHWPYVAYFRPFPSASNFIGSDSDGSIFSSPWNRRPGLSEIPTSYVFPAMDVYHHSRGQHSYFFPRASSHIAGPVQPSLSSMAQRVARNSLNIPRSESFVNPSAVDHGTNDRAGSSVAASMLPPYPGSAALQAHFQHPPGNLQGMHTPLIPAARRFSGNRNMSRGEPGAWEREHFHSFASSQAERDPIWEPYHQLPGSPSTGIRPAYIRQRRI